MINCLFTIFLSKVEVRIVIEWTKQKNKTQSPNINALTQQETASLSCATTKKNENKTNQKKTKTTNCKRSLRQGP